MKSLKPRQRRSIGRRIMLYMVCGCLLTAALSVVIYNYSGVSVFAQRIAEEMFPRAHAIARLSSRYMDGQVGFDSFRDFVTNDQTSGSRVFIYDEQGNLFAYSARRRTLNGTDMEITDEEDPGSEYTAYVSDILQTGGSISETNWRKLGCILVGVPVRDNLDRVSGVVLLTKRATDVRTAMSSMSRALLVSAAIASVVMAVSAYFLARHVVMPLREMTAIANAMAAGDFSARANVDTDEEIGQLGGALNFLSGELSTTIGDLVLARNRLTTILSGLSEGIVAIDCSLDFVTFINPAARRMLDVTEEQIDLSDLRFSELLGACRLVLEDRQQRSVPLQVGDRTLLLTASCSQAAVGLQPGAVILVQDVTEAERLEQTRRDYVANVSHELRTPIASIRSLAEALNDGLVKQDTDRTRYYGYILRESLRLTRLINDLLELSRLQSGTIALEKHSFGLAALLSEVSDRMRLNASYSDIALLCEPLQKTEVFSNRDRIEQVLVALVDNAIKYASDSGTITIRALDCGESVTVEVRNTGHIDEQHLPHLFERFYKADASHSEVGTGLGLSIVQEVLQQLGERIEARNDGGEVVFSFTIKKA